MKNINVGPIDKLGNKINLYSNLIEIFKYLINIFEDYFKSYNIEDSHEKNEEFIVDFHTFILSSHREKILEIFYEILRNKDFEVEEYIALEREEFLNIGNEALQRLLGTLNLFERDYDFEIRSFLSRKEDISEEILKDLNEFSQEYIHNNINYLGKKLGQLKESMNTILFEELNNYNRNIWKLMKDIREILKDRDSTHGDITAHRILEMREKFIGYVDEIENDIGDIGKNEFIAPAMTLIEENLGMKIREKERTFKNCLNEWMAKELDINEKDKDSHILYQVNETSCRNNEVQELSNEIFEIQYNFLRKILNFTEYCFNNKNEEMKFRLDSIFLNEFCSPVFFIKSIEEFNSICTSLEEKRSYIIYNFVISAFKGFKEDYYYLIIEELLNKKNRINSMNIFKSISKYNGDNHCNNLNEIIEVFNKINEIYKGYEKWDKSVHLPEVLDIYNRKQKISENIFDKYIYDNTKYKEIFKSESYENISSIDDKKCELYGNITKFKDHLWNLLKGDLIYYFDSLFQSIGRSMEFAKRNTTLD